MSPNKILMFLINTPSGNAKYKIKLLENKYSNALKKGNEGRRQKVNTLGLN